VELRRYEEAAAAYREATALQPDDPSPWNNLSALQLRQNNPRAARDSASRLNEAHPDFAPGWMNRALAEDQLGNTAEALAALERYFDLSGDRRAALERWATGLRSKTGGTSIP
jgi:predicted Zn-dependent protease